jgi:hypothetical protein
MCDLQQEYRAADESMTQLFACRLARSSCNDLSSGGFGTLAGPSMHVAQSLNVGLLCARRALEINAAKGKQTTLKNLPADQYCNRVNDDDQHDFFPLYRRPKRNSPPLAAMPSLPWWCRVRLPCRAGH